MKMSSSSSSIENESPIIQMERIVNLRDLHSASPTKIKAGTFYRCGSLSRATAKDAERFQNELKIKTYIDLRSKTEVTNYHNNTTNLLILIH